MAILHTEYAESAVRGQKDIDNDIRNYIYRCPDGNYDDILMEDGRWDVFYHLSQMRTSLLNWYEFEEGSSLLEVGAGLGALTGLFCNRCTRVTVVERSLSRASLVCERYVTRDNLDVYAADIRKVEIQEKFDYIVAAGILEIIGEGNKQPSVYENFLISLKRFLKPNGKILLAVENRYGIRYFCGTPEPYTGKPFSGINKYPEAASGRGFSRKELVDILNAAGLDKYKFYYPLPDYQLPQLIYSDEYLPSKNINERLMPYYQNKDTLLAYENDLYADLAENEVFSFFANSFLIECTQRGDYCSVIYAAVTTDRGEEHGFATTIHSNHSVKKSALYPAGQHKLEQFFHNITDIQNHGVTTVPHTMEKGKIVMPRIDSMPFSDNLNQVVKEGGTKIVQVFDQLYECVLNSSQHVLSENNALCKKGEENLPWGVILEKSYIDMVPFNCFYIDNQFMFFDQEFVRNNYPAKYTLFRAIFYTYLSVSETENILPIQECKEKYQLEELWDIFIQEEEKFVSDNRNYDLYQHFYEWACVDREVIYKRADTLLQYGSLVEMGQIQESAKEEEYVPTEKLLEIQKIEKGLLAFFKNICEKNELTYYIFYGTLLGAVRHGGFIPWDDDVDVVMPRADYDKLVKIADEEFEYPYFMETLDNSTESFYGGYAKLRNSDTTGIELNNWEHHCNHGIWMDIFPLDVFDENNQRRKRQLLKVRLYQRLLFAKVYGDGNKQFKDVPKERWKRYCFLSLFMNKSWLRKQLKKVLAEANGYESKYVAILARYTTPDGYQFFDKKVFECTKEVTFEEMKVRMPAKPEQCLEITAGIDYMKYPPLYARVPHHHAFFDTKLSYRLYAERFFNIFTNLKNREIIIFGAGMMFDDYMQKYGKKYMPQFIVDNNSAQWGGLRHGIMIKAPQSLLDLNKEKSRIIICNIYYKEIEQQLQEMEISEYYIYVQEKEWLLQEPPK